MRTLLAIVLCLSAASAGRAAPDGAAAAATIVVYNRNDPASRALAKYYAEKRAIPFSQVLGLDCPATEEINRDQYFVRIEAPIRDAFTKNGWWTIERNSDGDRFVAKASKRFVAMMRGMPLKIAPQEKLAAPANPEIQPGSPMATLLLHNEASVDSELSAMFALLERYPAVLANPYFRRFTPILDVPPSQGPLLVCRLDGSSDAIVRRMIDDAIATEKTGLWGWAYVDARNIHDGGYKEGDDWMTAVAALMRRQGIPVISDYAPEIFPAGFPITDAAVYYGWYTLNVAGPFAEPGFQFVPGAVAVHIHSMSAHTLRDPAQAWAAPLLAAGATAVAGNVYEPYLSLTVHLDVLQDRLMNGFTLAEAAYSGQRGLSWMGVVLGDPIYRPYAIWADASRDGGEGDSPWRQYRRAVLTAGGSVVAAADLLAELAEKTGNSMFLEALGQAQASEGDFAKALETLDAALAIEERSKIRFRITLGQIEMLRRSGDAPGARARLAEAIGKFRGGSQRATLDELALILNPPPTAAPIQ